MCAFTSYNKQALSKHKDRYMNKLLGKQVLKYLIIVIVWLLSPMVSYAKVVHSGQAISLHIPLASMSGEEQSIILPVDIDQDGQVDLTLAHYATFDISNCANEATCSLTTTGGKSRWQLHGLPSGRTRFLTSNEGELRLLNQGEVINETKALWNAKRHFFDGQQREALIGVQFERNNNSHYAWLLINKTAVDSNGTRLEIAAYAYQSEANKSIAAGSITEPYLVSEPSSLFLIFLSLIVIFIIRKLSAFIANHQV